MQHLKDLVGRFETLVGGAAILVAAIVALWVLQRLLSRDRTAGDARRFRNQLVMGLSSLFMVLIVLLLLPIRDSLRGQLLGLYGIVVSATIALSAPSVLGNAMAGIMLKSLRNFRSGDFITVGEHFGRVSARGLFHTEIQLPDRDLTTLPNLMLATHPVTVIRGSGTVVSATVSLGYDVHHARVEPLLKDAVVAADLEEPFVQVLDLGDHAVTYKAAGILRDVKTLLGTRSRLRVAILDRLHESGVEIVSPGFRNIRRYEPGESFLPEPPRRATEATPESIPVDVVFDKAESAESVELLERRRKEAQAALEKARADAKAAADDDARERADGKVRSLERRIEALDARLERMREEQENSED